MYMYNGQKSVFAEYYYVTVMMTFDLLHIIQKNISVRVMAKNVFCEGTLILIYHQFILVPNLKIFLQDIAEIWLS